MYSKIMVPYDGSPFSRRALPLATDLARRHDAELHIVHAIAPIFERAYIEADGVSQAELDDLARSIHDDSGVRTTAVRRTGRVVDELRAYRKEKGIDLIVMATHGWGGLQRAWLGSVADELIRRAQVPVLAFRSRSEDDAPATNLDRVLIPLDGSELSESILDRALKLGGTATHYTLLRVIPYGDPGSLLSRAVEAVELEKLIAKAEVEATAYLDELSTRLRTEGYEVETRVLKDPQPARAILGQARESNVDLIALSTRGRGGLARIFALGSIADKVLRGAERPVMVYRPAEITQNEKVATEKTAAEMG